MVSRSRGPQASDSRKVTPTRPVSSQWLPRMGASAHTEAISATASTASGQSRVGRIHTASEARPTSTMSHGGE